MSVHTIQELMQFQAMPLEVKVAMTKVRIRDWVNYYGTEGVYVSFSGGKDSTVLLHIVREMYPTIPAVFVDTGLEFPEIRDFVKTFDNVVWLKPEMNFRKTIETYGYPMISKEVSQVVSEIRSNARKLNCKPEETKRYKNEFEKDGRKAQMYPSFCKNKYKFLFDAPFEISHLCCKVNKKTPAIRYEKETGRTPIIATMTDESRLRQTKWLQTGCNAFDSKRPMSKPISFWREQDILRYIKDNNIPIASVYGDIVPVSEGEFIGQMDIADFGLSEDKRPLKTTGEKRTGCMFCGFGCHQKDDERFVRMKLSHPKVYDYIMRPWEQGGLNYKEVIEWLNEHGNLHIKY